jgi:hypothetical protein
VRLVARPAVRLVARRAVQLVARPAGRRARLALKVVNRILQIS